MIECVFCNTNCTEPKSSGATTIYNCPHCGLWEVSYTYKSEFESSMNGIYANKRHLIAGYLYEFNRSRVVPFVFVTGSLKRLLSDGRIPKTPMQRLERLLLNMYKHNDRIGVFYRIDVTTKESFKNDKFISYFGEGHDECTEIPLSFAYARDSYELKRMLFSLENLGYLARLNSETFYLSPRGFERAEELLSTNIDSKSVFIAMGFESDLLDACESAIKPACENCGFDALLISDKHHNNGITDEIMVEIKRSKFVIVDFTYNNNGAYFEAGYAQGLGHPIIRCCKKDWFDNPGDGKGLHFDVKHYNTIIWENHDDLYKKLKDNIRLNIPDAILTDK